jgi:hypothetical protein
MKALKGTHVGTVLEESARMGTTLPEALKTYGVNRGWDAN